MIRGESIVLIGMPGAGKSTLGVLLAKELVRDFIDTDILIQSEQQKSLQDIVNDHGYQRLRALESKVLEGLDCAQHVIATGGSAIYSEAGVARLKELGQLIYIAVPEQVLLQRIDNMDTRGLAKPHGQSFSALYAERDQLYRHHADIIIDGAAKSPAQLVSEIIYSEGEQYAEIDA